MKEDFDAVLDRRHTHSRKHDMVKEQYGVDCDRAIALSVADMDFKSPQCIRSAICRYVKDGALGYCGDLDDIYDSLINFYEKRHGTQLERSWLRFGNSIVDSIIKAIRAYTNEGDKIIIQPPVYHQFANTIRNNGRIIAENPLILKDGKYFMDFDGLEAIVEDSKVKMMILCNPHNPTGRAWTKEELSRLSQILVKNGVVLISDDAHGDLVHKGYDHNMVISLGGSAKQNTVTFISCHKGFNMCGMQVSNIIIPNPSLRKKFDDMMKKDHSGEPNILGAVAVKAAYDNGIPWLDECIKYIEGNFEFLEEFLNERMPEVRLIKPEATFLAWLDFRELGLDDEELIDMIIKKAGVIVNPGMMFGKGGSGFVRMNVACPRSILKKALERIASEIGRL